MWSTLECKDTCKILSRTRKGKKGYIQMQVLVFEIEMLLIKCHVYSNISGEIAILTVVQKCPAGAGFCKDLAHYVFWLFQEPEG